MWLCAYVSLIGVGYVFLFQAEDGIRDLVRSRGLGDVYKRQRLLSVHLNCVSTILRAGQEVGAQGSAGEHITLHLSLIHI